MSALPKILLTGFDPFWGYPHNVSQVAVEHFTEKGKKPFQVMVRILPTSFGRAPEAMARIIAELQPDIVLSFGLLEHISAFRIERIGLNINHAIKEDNDGDKPAHRYILGDAPTAYEVNLPFEAVLSALEGAGLPVEVSYHAQTFVCNHLIYTTMHLVAQKRFPIRYGFIHLPPLPEDVKDQELGTSRMPYETVVKGVGVILDAVSGSSSG
jgi:pyroglutamyl-peptidase